MSRIIDKILNDVCLDERITDGIFRMDEVSHMDALREYLVKRGITIEDATRLTNRMVEGKYPERQAYRSDGILVTWPTPQHKAKAMQKEPGKYVEQDPKPEKEEPSSQPPSAPIFPQQQQAATTPEKSVGTPLPPSAEEPPSEPEPQQNIFQGEKQLAIEPPRGSDKPEPVPQSPISPPTPKTPEQIGAEKEVAKQIMATDDTALYNIPSPLTELINKWELEANILESKLPDQSYQLRECAKQLRGIIK